MNFSNQNEAVTSETIRVYVGTDESQMLAYRVLAHSITRHTSAKVEVVPMLNLPIPIPKDPKKHPRTGFSLARFCIPQLAGYQGKAIYMDADMLVLQDILGLWNLPLNGAHLMIQGEQRQKYGWVKVKKVRQCSVMLLDCAALDWDIQAIVKDMDDGRYTYSQLLADLCIVPEERLSDKLPDYWNHLDRLWPDTCLLHYTNMTTQPWVRAGNPLSGVWFDEVRLMLEDGSLTKEEIQKDIDLGYLRPSLMKDIHCWHLRSNLTRKLNGWYYQVADYVQGYRKHKDFYQKRRAYKNAQKQRM